MRLSCSLTFGMRHAPAAEPSESPQDPLASVLTDDIALVQSWSPKQLACWSQIKPVRLSFTVPSALLVNRGETAAPFLSAASWFRPSQLPVAPHAGAWAVQDIASPQMFQQPFWPVFATGPDCL